MTDEEKKLIEEKFGKCMEVLISEKGKSVTEIVASEQPMILLFKELLYKIEKKQRKNIIQEKVIHEMAKKLNQYGFFCVEPLMNYDGNSEYYIKTKTVEEIKEYFYRKVENNE